MSCKCMGEMIFYTKWLMGVLYFFVICFPIKQFDEILEERSDNPPQQPRNPWFVMSSMLYCKQTQAAYQGSKDLLSYARSLPCKMGEKRFSFHSKRTFWNQTLKVKRASQHKWNQISFVQNKKRIMALFIVSGRNCNGLGLDFTENNQSLFQVDPWVNRLLQRKGFSTQAHHKDYFQKWQRHYGFPFGLLSDCSVYISQGNIIQY